MKIIAPLNLNIILNHIHEAPLFMAYIEHERTLDVEMNGYYLWTIFVLIALKQLK